MQQANTLTTPDFLSILLSDLGGLTMRGKIRSWGKCPEPGCNLPFKDTAAGPMCPVHHIRPDAYLFDFCFRGRRERLFYDKDGRRLDTYKKSLELQILINKEIREHTFDPSKYVRRESKDFWVSTLLGEFQDRKVGRLAPSYQHDFKRMIRVASEFFGEQDARDLRPLHIEDLQTNLEKTLSPKSVKNYLDLLRSFLRWCWEKKGIIDRVPAFPDRSRYEPAPKWLAQEDQINLFQHVPEEDKPIIAFLMLHGCRPGEARALQLKDVDLRRQAITISRTWSGTQIREVRKGPRGSAEPYTIGIHPEMAEWIQKRVSEALPAAFLFVNHGEASGRHYTQSALDRIWNKVREAAGLSRELRLYDATRHSFASNLSNSGTDLKKLKDMMGHADIRTTLKYAHGNVEHTRADLAKLSLKKPADVVPIRKEAISH